MPIEVSDELYARVVLFISQHPGSKRTTILRGTGITSEEWDACRRIEGDRERRIFYRYYPTGWFAPTVENTIQDPWYPNETKHRKHGGHGWYLEGCKRNSAFIAQHVPIFPPGAAVALRLEQYRSTYFGQVTRSDQATGMHTVACSSQDKVVVHERHRNLLVKLCPIAQRIGSTTLATPAILYAIRSHAGLCTECNAATIRAVLYPPER